MKSSDRHALRTAYNRYGPRTDRDDIAAGYAAAIGAVLAAALYVTSVWIVFVIAVVAIAVRMIRGVRRYESTSEQSNTN